MVVFVLLGFLLGMGCGDGGVDLGGCGCGYVF